MGRAFRVLKRTAHLTVAVSERPEAVVRVAAGETAGATRRARTAKKPAAKTAAQAKE
jgi:hypothetical protein